MKASRPVLAVTDFGTDNVNSGSTIATFGNM